MSTIDTTSTHRPVKKREVFAWTMYDWANSAYSTFQITILQVYLLRVVLPGDAGVLAYGYCIGISTLIAAVASPILGAIADAHASKRFWLSVMTMAGAGAGVAMYFVPVEQAWIFVGLFFVTSLSFELAWGLYNAFLPEIADEKSMNRVSSYGFAVGYVGGGLALVVGVLVLTFGGALGLPTDLSGDCIVGREIDFDVALPPGEYTATVTVGEPRKSHELMDLSFNGTRAESLRTTQGEILSRDYPVTVSGDKLSLQLTGPSAAEPAALAGLRIAGTNLLRPLLFDFGTASSKGEAGSIWVTETDEFKDHDRAALAAKSKSIPADQLPTSLEFGFRPVAGETLASRDMVMIPRLQLGLLIMGLWWAVFSLPTLLILRDRVTPRAGRESLLATATRAAHEVGRTLTSVRHYRTLFLFLVAFLIYNDGVATVITQAPVFADKVLHIDPSDLIMVVLMIQFVSMPGALFMGWLAGKIGEKTTLLLCIGIYIGWLLAAFISNNTQFWIMGAVLALVMGGIQSVSRAIMGLMTPTSRSGEFFGFFNLSSKATSFAGPMLFSSILAWTGRPHLAILSLLVFFVAGGALVWFVNVAEGRRRAIEENGTQV